MISPSVTNLPNIIDKGIAVKIAKNRESLCVESATNFEPNLQHAAGPPFQGGGKGVEACRPRLVLMGRPFMFLIRGIFADNRFVNWERPGSGLTALCHPVCIL